MSKIIRRALKILEARMVYKSNTFANPDDTRNYLRLKLGNKEREIFAVLYLTNRHQLISYEELFLEQLMVPVFMSGRSLSSDCT